MSMIKQLVINNLKNEIMELEDELKPLLDENGDLDYVLYRNNNSGELHICNIFKNHRKTLCSERLNDDYDNVYSAFTENDIRLIAGYLEKKHINGYGDIHICGTCISSLYGDKDY